MPVEVRRKPVKCKTVRLRQGAEKGNQPPGISHLISVMKPAAFAVLRRLCFDKALYESHSAVLVNSVYAASPSLRIDSTTTDVA